MTHTTRSVPAAVAIAIAGLILAQPVAARQTTTAQNPHHPGASHVMGFDLDKTAHHFFLYEDGGAIDVSVKDKADKANLEAIRSHLAQITEMFGHGHFEAPMLVHDTKDVPGAADLMKLTDKVSYKYMDTAMGGRVDVVTKDKDALAAVHAFLKFQIKEHGTGDSATPAKRKD